MIEPFPAEYWSVDPLKGFPVCSKFKSALRTVFPISKHSPMLLRCPSRNQRTYLCIWSDRSIPWQLIKLSARHNAIEVSSVQYPGANSNGPPPTISWRGENEPGDRNSRLVPSASPTAKPIKHPRKRSICFNLSLSTESLICYSICSAASIISLPICRTCWGESSSKTMTIMSGAPDQPGRVPARYQEIS